jgi:hypothetical protein
MQRLSVQWLCAFSLILGSLYVPPASPQAKKGTKLNPVSARAQTGQQARQAMTNFPPQCDALIRPGFEQGGIENDYKLVDTWAHAIETDDEATFHRLLPDAARRVFKGDTITDCANAAAVNRSWEGETIAFAALMYNQKWEQAMMSFQDKEHKRTVAKFNELIQKYTELYKQLLIISSAPSSVYVPPLPITCTSTRIGDTVTTSCY